MTYHHLSREERYQISALLKEGLTQAQIVLNLGRQKSTINTNGHLHRPTWAQSRMPIDLIVSGNAMSLFHASHAASMMAS